jgi:hypothetical protein
MVPVVAPDTEAASIGAERRGGARSAWIAAIRTWPLWPASLSRSTWSVWPTWPLWIALAVFARLLVQPVAVLNDPDTYLHIAAGRWMWAHLALATGDPFSYTMAGAHWSPGEWLAELIFAGIYDHAGWSGVVILTAACLALSLALLCRFLTPRVGALPAVMMSLAAAALVFPHTVARAHMLAMPLLVLWSGLLLAPLNRTRNPPWAALPAMVLWANLHASFLFGIGLAGWVAAEAVWESPSRRDTAVRWGAFVVGAVAAGMLTPAGMTAFLQPLRLMGMPALQSSFGEWLPPDFSTFPALELWILAVMAIGFASRTRLNWTRLLLLLLLVHMALRHVRHADLLGLVGPLVLADGIGAALAAHGEMLSGLSLWRGAERLAGGMRWPALAVGLGIGTAMALPLILAPLHRTDGKVTPASGLAAARRLGLTGPVFNSEAFGGYLAFRGVPDFIDGRVEMFGNDFLAADVAAEGGDEATLSGLLARYGVTWTLLAPEVGAVAALDRMPGWRRVYSDPYAVIHVRAPEGRH